MRRSALKLLAAGGIALTGVSSLAGKAPKVDKRLLGTWRSDKERTTKLWRYKTELDPEKKAEFEGIFGKLVRRFTATHVYSEFDGDKTSTAYWVVGSDSRSVVIATREEDQVQLQQIFFEENSFYVVTGYSLEFFVRVSA